MKQYDRKSKYRLVERFKRGRTSSDCTKGSCGTVHGETDALVLKDADFLDIPNTATRCCQWTFHSGRYQEDEWQSHNRLNRTEKSPGGLYDSCFRRTGGGRSKELPTFAELALEL